MDIQNCDVRLFLVLIYMCLLQINITSTGCANYSKSVCLQVLRQYTNCLSCEQKYIAISASIDQESNENTAQAIKTGLSLLGASQTCLSSLIPFMCLYLFPLCDSNTTVSRQQCIYISTVLCKDEWQTALSIQTIKDQIPKCESLPSITGKGLLYNLCVFDLNYLFLIRNSIFI